MLLTALAGVTEHIGLIATASTTYNEPYNLARRFASLDHISGGRAGWNIVTTAGADAGRATSASTTCPRTASATSGPPSSSRCRQQLWDSWEDDALVADKETGVWGDDAKIHRSSTPGGSSGSPAR